MHFARGYILIKKLENTNNINIYVYMCIYTYEINIHENIICYSNTQEKPMYKPICMEEDLKRSTKYEVIPHLV